MLRYLRLAAIAGSTIGFWGAWYLFPALFHTSQLSYLGGISAVVWGMDLLFLRKLAEVSALAGLTNRERERLIEKLKNIRHRIWWIGGVCLLAALVIWMLVATELVGTSAVYAAFLGFLVGVVLSFLILIPSWFDELQGFIDRVNQERALKASQETELQELASHNGKNGKK